MDEKIVKDCISRQAAIDALGERPMVWAGSDYELGARNQYDADVLAIETVPAVQSFSCDHENDTISRQSAIDALDVLCQEHRYKIPGKIETYSQYNEAWQDALDRAEGAIFNLPSAQPERIRGRWIPNIYPDVGDGYRCSQCGAWHVVKYNFCHNCGADMREADE